MDPSTTTNSDNADATGEFLLPGIWDSISITMPRVEVLFMPGKVSSYNDSSEIF